MKVRYLVEIDKDPNHVLDMQADCQDIEDALAVRFHRLEGQVKARPLVALEEWAKLFFQNSEPTGTVPQQP